MNTEIKKILVMVLLMFTLVSCTDKSLKEESGANENNFIENEVNLDGDMGGTEIFSLYNYVQYSQEDIEASTKLNVLFFNDPESVKIGTLKDNLLKTKIHDGLVMYEVDFNIDTELKTRYNVGTGHTFVQVDNDGNMMRKWEGSLSISEMHTALTSTETLIK